MKNSVFIFAVIGLLTGTLVTGCSKKSDQQVENAKQKLNDARIAYLAEWQKFKAESEDQIEANEKRIDKFKERTEQAGAAAKKKYNKAVAELEQKNRDLKKKLAEYKDEGESKWEEFKTNFKHDMDGVGRTIEDLFKDNG